MAALAKESTRQAYGETLVELGARIPQLVVLDADISRSTETIRFAERYPERFINVGAAEQNMLGIAAGLASCAMLPFVSTYAVFATMRALEQLRTLVAYPGLNVKVVASHGGLTPGPDGVTHQAIEDLSITRSIPGLRVVVPADATATRKLVSMVAQLEGPTYVRLTREPVPAIYPDKAVFNIGQAVTLKPGRDVTLIAIGDMVSIALATAEMADREGIDVRVLDMHTLKPLDEEAVMAAATETGAIVTVEDNSYLGGLGGAVCELLSGRKPTPVVRIGIKDTFTESGPYSELLAKYGLSPSHILTGINQALSMKGSYPATETGGSSTPRGGDLLVHDT